MCKDYVGLMGVSRDYKALVLGNSHKGWMRTASASRGSSFQPENITYI